MAAAPFMRPRRSAAWLLCALCGCASTQHPAPVTERGLPPAAPGMTAISPVVVPVPPSQTTTAPLALPPAVQGRAFENNPGGVISEPSAVKLPYSDEAYARLTQAAQPAQPAPATGALPAPTAAPATTAADADDKVAWGWPTAGEVVAGFDKNASLKGIDIGGRAGQAVLASAPGTVAYSGSGMRGYGKLIVIKHNKTYSSVYAHNSALLVAEGQSVVKGQKIAEMGDSDGTRIALHFEIRRLGEPVDPTALLPAR